MRLSRCIFALGLLAALAVTTAGCTRLSNLKNLFDASVGVTVSPQAVVVAANTFNALEATATNYLKLKRCDGKNGPVCRDQKATDIIIPAVRSGRVARENLEQFLKDHPGELGPSGVFDALRQANDTLQSVIAQYRIGIR